MNAYRHAYGLGGMRSIHRVQAGLANGPDPRVAFAVSHGST
jgi:hypothetical protein